MDQLKRSLLFVVLTMVVWGAWFGFFQPKFFPAPPAKPARPAELAEADARPVDVPDAGVPDAAAPADTPDAGAAPARVAVAAPPQQPRRSVLLGSSDPASGYLQEVTLTSRGAAIQSIALNDPRYRELTDRGKPLRVVDASGIGTAATFQTNVPAIDSTLAGFATDSGTVDWEVVRLLPDPDAPKINRGVVFRLRAADGSVEVEKTYGLRRVANSADWTVRDTASEGYVLDVGVTLRNLSDAPQALAYDLQGPVGLPLENREHTSKYRDLELGFLEPDGDLNASAMPATDVTKMANAADAARAAQTDAAQAEEALQRNALKLKTLQAKIQANPQDKAAADDLVLAKASRQDLQAFAEQQSEAARQANRELEQWKAPFRYLGVEVQYFAALLFPTDDRPVTAQFEQPRVERIVPQLATADKEERFNDISFTLSTTPVAVPAGGTVRQDWSLYAGPKRKALLAPLGADEVLDLGQFLWFRFGWAAAISNGMLWILGNLHAAGFPYWLAIISLTVIVRGCMFPLSRKQAIGAAKMKELQPKITELKAKFGDDREGMAKAQMELFSKHGYNPLAGCLPIFFQLPIFIGLYQALQTSVDLRMANFLWIDNLAAPDQLFRLPVSLPVLGRDFNLLPLITVALFYVQQKLFMPPATTPEQEAQYKMMNVMTLVMGFFFYHVPAGLCVYFIASSLWSITERKLLANTKAAHVGPAEAAQVDREIAEAVSHKQAPGRLARAKAALADPNRKPTWIERMMEAADTARSEAQQGQSLRDSPKGDGKNSDGKGGKGKGGKGKSRTRR